MSELLWLFAKYLIQSPGKDGHDLPAVLRPALQAGKTLVACGTAEGG